MQKCQGLEDLNQYFTDDIKVESFVILGLNEAIQVQAQHFCHDADVPPKLKISFDFDDVFVGRGVVSGYF